MRENKIRRLPVCDPDGKLVGVISLSNIGIESERERREGMGRLIRSTEVADECRHAGCVRQERRARVSFAIRM